MTEDTARRTIDWLHDRGCRVLALMGGEPLLGPQFAHKAVYYAAKKGCNHRHERESTAANAVAERLRGMGEDEFAVSYVAHKCVRVVRRVVKCYLVKHQLAAPIRALPFSVPIFGLYASRIARFS